MKHPIIGNNCLHREAYETVCRRIRKFYGVPDAEVFFAAKRREMLDKCSEDTFGWKRYATLKDWHESKVLAARMEPSNVEVRGPTAALSPEAPSRLPGYAAKTERSGNGSNT